MTAAGGRERESWGERFARAASVFLDRRVLIILVLGFSSGLPLALTGSTLSAWTKESGVSLGPIGLFSLGAARRCLRRAGARPRARPPARLARRRANPADGGDPAARLPGPRQSSLAGGLRGADRGHGVGHPGHRHRRLPRRISSRRRAIRRHGLFRGRLSGR